MEKTMYAIAVKHDSPQAAPVDWKNQLAEIDGVTSVACDPGRH